MLRRGSRSKGRNNQQHTQKGRLRKRCDQDEVAPLRERNPRLAKGVEHERQGAPAEEMEEVGTIVGGRPQIKGVVAKKLFPAFASGKECACRLEVIITLQYIETVVLVRRDPGKVRRYRTSALRPTGARQTILGP